MWRGLFKIYEKRCDEYKKLFDDEANRSKSAVELRFQQMKAIFEINDTTRNLHSSC